MVDRDFTNCIVMGDSRDVLKALPPESIDMVITSPPYNFCIEYDVFNDDMPIDQYFNDLLMPVWRECYRVVKHGGRVAIIIQPMYDRHVPTHHHISRQIEEAGFSWHAELVWDKSNVHGNVSLGSIGKPSSPYIRSTMEFIEIACKTDRKKRPDPDREREIGTDAMVSLTRDEYISWTDARWSIPSPSDMKKHGHPAMFPEELPLRLMKLFTYVGDSILDPFGGTGTTALVAWKCSRLFTSIDVSESYCKTAYKRVMRVANQSTLIPPVITMTKPRLVRFDR